MPIDLDNITSGYNTSKLNSNFQKIEDTINDKLLWTEGSTPGETLMERNLDMNGFAILNAAIDPTDPNSLATKEYVDESISHTLRFPDTIPEATYGAAGRANSLQGYDNLGNPAPIFSYTGTADLAVKLASHDSTLGASLVGLSPAGTVKDAINYVTPEMFGGQAYDKRTMFGANKNSAADIAAAVGAGTVIDSADAIQAAVNTGKSVRYGPGVYYTSKPIEQSYYTGDMIGTDVVQTAICKYTKTVDTKYGVDAVWVLGENTGAYMRYKRMTGMSLVRAKFDANSGALQQPKAIENYFDFTDVNLIPYGYGLYAPKIDHFQFTNMLLQGNETNFYTDDMWMSRLSNVWLQGGAGLVMATGTSVTFEQVWSIQASWNTYDTLGNLIKKYYCYDIGGVYLDLASVAADYAGADGRPTEDVYHFRQGIIANASSLGAEQCHARRLIYFVPGASAFSTGFVNVDTLSCDTFYNKYGDVSLAGKRRVLIDVGDFNSLAIKQGRIRSVYADTSSAPQKPHIAYVGKKSHLSLGSLYFFIDSVKGVQLNDTSYFTTTNFTTGVISPVAVTQSEVWVDSDVSQASSFQIANGVLDIDVAGGASDLFWDNGSTSAIGSGAHRFGGYNARIHNASDVAAFRVQSPSRAASFITTGTSVGIYDYTTNQWILRQEQGTSGSSFNHGSKLNAQDAIINFQTSGTGVTFDSRLLARTASGSNQLFFQGSVFAPFTDNNIPLGGAANRWSVVYAGTGTINTSDQRYKKDISTLSPLEIQLARNLSKLYKTFRFKNYQEIHIGVIAQDVIKEFEAVGLDPFSYGICTYDEWEGKEATYDSDGNELVSSIEPGSIYGIRYEELNCFINAGLESWMDSLEKRLEKLESIDD